MTGTNVIKLDDVVYFPYDERRDCAAWQRSWDVYVRLRFKDVAFEFCVGDEMLTALREQLEDPGCSALTLITEYGGTHVINKSFVDAVTVQREAIDDYPDVLKATDGDLLVDDSVLGSTSMRQDDVLWFLSTASEEECQICHDDFTYLVSLRTRLNARMPGAIERRCDQIGGDDDADLPDEEGSNYRERFLQAWGYRTYFADGHTQFHPGYSEHPVMREVGCDARNRVVLDGNLMLPVIDNIDEFHMVPLRHVAMLEFPTVFLGINEFARQSRRPLSVDVESAEAFRGRSRPK